MTVRQRLLRLMAGVKTVPPARVVSVSGTPPVTLDGTVGDLPLRTLCVEGGAEYGETQPTPDAPCYPRFCGVCGLPAGEVFEFAEGGGTLFLSPPEGNRNELVLIPYADFSGRLHVRQGDDSAVHDVDCKAGETIRVPLSQEGDTTLWCAERMRFFAYYAGGEDWFLPLASRGEGGEIVEIVGIPLGAPLRELGGAADELRFPERQILRRIGVKVLRAENYHFVYESSLNRDFPCFAGNWLPGRKATGAYWFSHEKVNEGEENSSIQGLHAGAWAHQNPQLSGFFYWSISHKELSRFICGYIGECFVSGEASPSEPVAIHHRLAEGRYTIAGEPGSGHGWLLPMSDLLYGVPGHSNVLTFDRATGEAVVIQRSDIIILTGREEIGFRSREEDGMLCFAVPGFFDRKGGTPLLSTHFCGEALSEADAQTLCLRISEEVLGCEGGDEEHCIAAMRAFLSQESERGCAVRIYYAVESPMTWTMNAFSSEEENVDSTPVDPAVFRGDEVLLKRAFERFTEHAYRSGTPVTVIYERSEEMYDEEDVLCEPVRCSEGETSLFAADGIPPRRITFSALQYTEEEI